MIQRSLLAVAATCLLGVGGNAAATEPSTDLQNRMRTSFSALAALQPFVASAPSFTDPANAQRIGSLIDQLAQTPHPLSSPSPKEPGLSILIGQFDDYLAGAAWQFQHRQYEDSRAKLRSVTAFCFACHTRLHADKDFEAATRTVSALKLEPTERADFLASTRQFDRALQLYREEIDQADKTERGHFQTLHVLDRALTILVRVKGDPKATLELLQRVKQKSALPAAYLDTVEQWTTDTKAWAADPFVPSGATPEALITKARTLIEATGAGPSSLFNQRHEIQFLRASNYLHEALTGKPNTPLRSEALYLLAISASTIGDPWLWQFDEVYLETCIREAPHSGGAQKCFGAFKGLKLLGYTGSSGTHLPEDELKKLSELRRLAY